MNNFWPFVYIIDFIMFLFYYWLQLSPNGVVSGKYYKSIYIWDWAVVN